MAPERTMRSTYFSNASQSGKAGGRPARGKVSKILTRHESKPVSKFCQKGEWGERGGGGGGGVARWRPVSKSWQEGELAEGARRRGACSERRLWASITFPLSGTATWTCCPKITSLSATHPRVSIHLV